MTAFRRVLTSVDSERRLAVARQWLCDHPLEQEVVILASSRGAADDLLRECVGTTGLFGVHRFTLLQFASELAAPALARQGVVPMSGLGQQTVAARSVYASQAAGELQYFGPVLDTPGFPRALARTLDELRLERVDPEALESVGAGGTDLGHLLRHYGEELGSWGLVDQAGILDAARTEALETHRYAQLPFLLLDLLPSSSVEESFLSAALATSPNVLALAPARDEVSARLLASALSTSVEELGVEPAAGSRLERLRHYVFESEVPAASAPDSEETPSLEFFSAPGEGRECVEIARRIVRLAERGVGFDQVAVLLRQPYSYLPLLEDALRRARVPAYFTRGTSRPDPAGRAFLALLACAAENLSASRFAEYLSLGEVPIPDEEGAPPERPVPWVEPAGEQLVLTSLLQVGDLSPEEEAELPPAPDEDPDAPVVAGGLQVPTQWEKLLVDAAVVGGRERWQRRLRGLAAELRLRLKELDEEEPRRAHISRQLTRLRHLERFALPVVAHLSELPRSAHWRDWLVALEKLATLGLRRPESVLGLLAELRPMAEVGPVDLEEVRSVLTDRLSFLQVEPPLRRFGAVFVATIPEALGRSFHSLFLPGLAEGVFPRKALEDPLLLDRDRQELEVGLAIQDRRIEEERRLLRIAAGAAREHLHISYPRVDAAEGRARVPSFYALDVLRAAEGELPELRDLEKRAAAASATRLGWPAPESCADAIDDAEYDLALLDPLLRRPAEESRGQGRFLLSCNSRLERSLKSRARRWRSFWSYADGLVDPDEAARAVLEEERPTRRSYSPTALQNYAGCPYRFLLYAIHRLREREEPVALEQLDPLTRGSLFHETQFALFGELTEAGLLPMQSADLPKLLDRADRVLNDTAARFYEDLAPAIPRVWTSEIESLRSDLRGWIRNVAEADENWNPIHFELAFGLPTGPDRDAASQEEEVTVLDGVRLRGSIDLVEKDPVFNRVRVTDHKTGKKLRDPESIISGGEVLQPVLYSLAAEKLLTQDGGHVESGRLFYCTQRGEYATVEVPLDEESRRAASQLFETIDGALVEGFLPAAPRERACSWCDYQAVCGPYEEIRVQRKRKDRLAPLVQLRRQR